MRFLTRMLVATFCCLLCATVSKNQTNDRRDGNWWRSLGRSDQVDYITGFFDGMELGSKFSYWAIMDKNSGDPALNKVASSYANYKQKYLKDVTNYQLADGLDTFYSDYRNRRITVDGAVWLVLNEIAGTPDVEMHEMIDSWRKNAAQP